MFPPFEARTLLARAEFGWACRATLLRPLPTPLKLLGRLKSRTRGVGGSASPREEPRFENYIQELSPLLNILSINIYFNLKKIFNTLIYQLYMMVLYFTLVAFEIMVVILIQILIQRSKKESKMLPWINSTLNFEDESGILAWLTNLGQRSELLLPFWRRYFLLRKHQDFFRHSRLKLLWIPNQGSFDAF